MWVRVMTAAAAVSAVTAACYPGGLAAAYCDCRDAGEVSADLDQAAEQEGRLSAELAQCNDRWQYKEELVAALARGDTSLAAVTDQFLEMDRPYPALLAWKRAAYGDVGDTELSARVVLKWVETRRPAESAGGPVLRARLAAEYAERFDRPPPDQDGGPVASSGR
jgi:hypothetical protein